MISRPDFYNVVLLILLAIAGNSYLRMYGKSHQLAETSSVIRQTRNFAQQIRLLRTQPDHAAIASQSERALAEEIENSASDAGISQSHIARIEPQSPRRLRDSSYMEHDTMLRLEGITLRQLAQLSNHLKQLSASIGPIYVSALRIDEPSRREQDRNSEHWNVDLTLTYYVYAPTSSSTKSP